MLVFTSEVFIVGPSSSIINSIDLRGSFYKSMENAMTGVRRRDISIIDISFVVVIFLVSLFLYYC